jgi:hypothetical protein
MAGLCYVMPVTGHKAYTGKEEEEEEDSPTAICSVGWYSSENFEFKIFV